MRGESVEQFHALLRRSNRHELQQSGAIAIELPGANAADGRECIQVRRPQARDFRERLVVQNHERRHGLAAGFARDATPSVARATPRRRATRRPLDLALSAHRARIGNRASQRDRCSPFNTGRLASGETQRASCPRGRHAPSRAPAVAGIRRATPHLVEIGTHAEHRQLVVTPARDALTGLAAEHFDEMHSAKAR